MTQQLPKIISSNCMLALMLGPCTCVMLQEEARKAEAPGGFHQDERPGLPIPDALATKAE